MYTSGRISKVAMATFMALICKVLLPSISTFETPPLSVPVVTLYDCDHEP